MRGFEEDPVTMTAGELVLGERQRKYGDPIHNYDRIAQLWSAMLGVTVTRRQAMQMMIILKLTRDLSVPGRDNEVDICGYALLLQMDREYSTFDDGDDEEKPER